MEPGLSAFLSAALIVALAAISIYDAKTLRIPNWFTLVFAIAGLAYVAAQYDLPVLVAHLTTAIVVAALFLLLAIAYRRWLQLAGLGMGDVKLVFGMGVWLGPWLIGPAIFLASVSALLFVAGRRLSGVAVDLHSRVPFVPFLSFGFLIVWLLHRELALINFL